MIDRRTVLAGGVLLLGCSSKRADPVTTLLKTPRADVFGHVARQLRAGMSLADGWRHLLRAGLRVEGEVHTRLATLSMRQLVGGADPLALLWAVDAFKLEQAVAEPAVAPVSVAVTLRRTSEQTLRQRLDDAFDALEPVGCSLTLRALYQSAGQAAATDALFRLAAREDGAGGHGTMYAVQAVRALELLGWSDAEAQLDQAVRRLMPPASWQAAPPADARARYIAHRKRPLPPPGDAASAWDALRLAAAEFATADTPQRVGLHAFDTQNALRVAWSLAKRPDTRNLLLMQAKDRLVAVRPEALRALTRPATGRPVARAEVVRRVLHKAGVDWHAVKYPAAVVEEAAAASKAVGARLLGAIDVALPQADATDWSRLADARGALSRG